MSKRQRKVWELLAQGKTNAEIGQDLGIDEKTVKAHCTAIFKVLNVQNRTQAALRFATQSVEVSL